MKREFRKSKEVFQEEELDYRPTLDEVYKAKEEIEKKVEHYREEKTQNYILGLMPPSGEKATDICDVKEEALDLQAKFDYLLVLMMNQGLITEEDDNFLINLRAKSLPKDEPARVKFFIEKAME